MQICEIQNVRTICQHCIANTLTSKDLEGKYNEFVKSRLCQNCNRLGTLAYQLKQWEQPTTLLSLETPLCARVAVADIYILTCTQQVAFSLFLHEQCFAHHG